MNFVSPTYLLFFIGCFGLYWLIGHLTARKILLLAASYAFLCWIYPWMGLVLAVYTAANYLFANKIAGDKKSKIYIAALILNFAGLILFKYALFFQEKTAGLLIPMGAPSQFFETNILLPLGISFYALQFVSYLTDLRRGVLEHTKFLDFALYAAFFPKLVAGPIERGGKFLPQLAEKARWSWDRFNEGIWLIILGYINKVVIADNVALLVDKVFALQKPTLLLLAVGSLAFTLQIYADFSGYTNLARGFAKLLGIDLTENFNSPYVSLSPSDFWQRWHISFSSWLRDYIFFPVRRWVVGLRIPEWLKVLAPSLIAMIFSGAWHGVGWNFIVWGAYFGVLIALYQIFGIEARLRNLSGVAKFIAWASNFALIVFGWMLFRASSVGWLVAAFQNPVYGRAMDSVITSTVMLTLCAFYALPMFAKRWLDNRPDKLNWKLAYYAVMLAVLLVFIESAQGEFIYFNF